MAYDFEVRRDDLAERRFVDVPEAERVRLRDGEVLLRVDRFAFTSNNVTYAALGETLRYWEFFPAAGTGYGRIPAWGFGTVLRSQHQEVVEGARYYGYFPMSTYAVMEPGRVSASTFSDAAAHRASLHPLYNQYTLTPPSDATTGAIQLLFRPLFITSFVLDDYFEERAYFGARRLIVSSASSKTAYGMAFLIAARARGTIELVGLTSAANAPFVRGLGFYDRTIVYDDLDSLAPEPDAVYVDFAANADVRRAVHTRLGARLRFSSAIGFTHHEQSLPSAPADREPPPGARPETFFAPAQIKKRIGDWGSQGFNERFDAAWQRFTSALGEHGTAWLRVVEGSGREAVDGVYTRALAGRLDANEGNVLSLP